MKCPHFVEEHRSMSALCLGVVVPFEPSRVDQLNFCRTGRHRIVRCIGMLLTICRWRFTRK